MEVAGRQYIGVPNYLHPLHFWALSDIHYGNRGMVKAKFLEDVAAIAKDPYAFWWGLGDYADFIAPGDKRWNPADIDQQIRVKDLGKLGRVQLQWVLDKLQPIKHKCLGLLFGNHEEKYMRFKDQLDLHAWFCQEMEAPNLGYCAFADVICVRMPIPKPKLFRKVNPFKTAKGGGTPRETIRFFMHHGCSGATTPAGKLNTLVRVMNSFEADVYMMGHVHDRLPCRKIRIAADATCTNLEKREMLGIVTGAYLDTYSLGDPTYGEVKGYTPVPLGAVCVSFDLGKRTFSCTL